MIILVFIIYLYTLGYNVYGTMNYIYVYWLNGSYKETVHIQHD